jgi:asparagine synthase (glutamine-hydrolysing)
MSPHFGRWNFTGKPIPPVYGERVASLLLPFGPDGGNSYSSLNALILSRAFATTPESADELQPHRLMGGAVLCWDGRLDNRNDIIRSLCIRPCPSVSDPFLVASSYERWGKECFAKLIGDWALSIWNPDSNTLLLAKDFLGSRSLYYSVRGDHCVWSSILDPLVLLSDVPVKLEMEYLAGWLGDFPATSLTPYRHVYCVPPASFVEISGQRKVSTKYWDFDPGARIRCKTDAEYEDQFRSLFAASVSRRLRSKTRILAELSGGMDSSSIVCMADCIAAQASSPFAAVDTISYFDDGEPDSNERPYVAGIELKRGKTGCHIDLSSDTLLSVGPIKDRFAAIPGSGLLPTVSMRRRQDYMHSNGQRVLLSGIGGDEMLGGVPTPVPELADLLRYGQFRRLGRQLVRWALAQRRPVHYLLGEATSVFLPVRLRPLANTPSAPPWLAKKFVRTYRDALAGYETRTPISGHAPSFYESEYVLEHLRRQLSCSVPSQDELCEKRYPYLDRDLVVFLFSIPREQLVRPGRRRSLMRRALHGIVPNEILERRRKAFAVRTPLVSVRNAFLHLGQAGSQMYCCDLGIVDRKKLDHSLEELRSGAETRVVPLVRTLLLEVWLRSFDAHLPSSRHDLSREAEQDFLEAALEVNP